jgi:hypothetical protein
MAKYLVRQADLILGIVVLFVLLLGPSLVRSSEILNRTILVPCCSGDDPFAGNCGPPCEQGDTTCFCCPSPGSNEEGDLCPGPCCCCDNLGAYQCFVCAVQGV